MNSRKAEFMAGIRAEIPIMVGGIPFGMIYGVLARGSGLSPEASQAMSAIVFAGSAQFVATQLLSNGAPAVVILLTVAVVNLRHALYSASLAPYLRKLNSGWKALLAYLLTDEAYAFAILHYLETPQPQPDETDNRHWFLLGAGLAMWASWQASTALGVFLGAQIPGTWALDFTLALSFIALLIPVLRDRPSLGAALAAGVTAVAAYKLPYNMGLVAAALAGVLVGLWMEGRQA